MESLEDYLTVVEASGAIVRFRVDGDVSVVELSGEIDLANASIVEAALIRRASRPGGTAFDLTRVAFIDLAGLRAIERATARSPGRSVLVCPQGSIASALARRVGRERRPVLTDGVGDALALLRGSR